MRLLDYALQKEQRELAQEAAAKEENVGMSKEYMAFLEGQMKKVQTDTSRIDAIREAKAEQIWLQRDAVLAAQVEARRRMMAEVDDCRRIQIKQQILQIEQERKEVAKYVAECVEAARKQNAIDKQKGMEATASTVSIANMNAAVAGDRQKRREEDQAQQALLERKAREYEERKHGQRLRELLG